MSARNTHQNKKLRALDRAIRRGRLPRYFDLVRWLRDRRYADTAGGAEALILAGRVKSESHTVGRVRVKNTLDQEVTVVERFAPVSIRETLRVEPA